MKLMKTHLSLSLFVAITLVCSQFGLSQTRRRTSESRSSSAETRATKDDGPSLEDTVSWLNQNVIRYAYVDQVKGKEMDRLTYDRDNSLRLSSFTISGCSLEYVVTQLMHETAYDETGHLWDTSRSTSVTRYSAGLSDLDGASIRVSKNSTFFSKKEAFSVGVGADNGAKVVKVHYDSEYHSHHYQIHTPDSDKYRNTDESSAGISFQFPEEITANRVAKAFARAITLCKKKQPF